MYFQLSGRLASACPKLLDCRAMMVARRYMKIVFAFGLSAGVLFAQLCQVVCLAANCTNPKPVPTTTTNHCHSTSSQPESPHESHNCQNHDLMLLLSASETAGLSDHCQANDSFAAALVPAQSAFVFLRQRLERARFSSLRSPPRTPLRLILRI